MDVFARKEDDDLPKQAYAITKLLEFPEKNGIEKCVTFLFGSFLQKAQPYYGDIDTLITLTINRPKEEAAMIFIREFKKKVRALMKVSGIYVVDIKAGVYSDGDAIHWTVGEVLRGQRDLLRVDFNGHNGEKKTLLQAVFDNALFKLDIIVPYFGKYLEATAVYFLDTYDGYIGLDQEAYATKERVLSSLKENAGKQAREGKLYKMFKRIFAEARLSKNTALAKRMIPLLQSQVALVSLQAGDLGTLKTIYEFGKIPKKSVLVNELEHIKDVLSNVTKFELPFPMIKKLILALENNYNHPKAAYDILVKLTEILVTEVNTQTAKYMTKVLGWNNIAVIPQNLLALPPPEAVKHEMEPEHEFEEHSYIREIPDDEDEDYPHGRPPRSNIHIPTGSLADSVSDIQRLLDILRKKE